MKVLIVGTGLAGMALAKSLEAFGKSFQMIAAPNLRSSTSIATGMYNPIVFRRLNLSWKVDTLLPVMHTFLAGMEAFLEEKINQPIVFEKRIPSEDYAQLWTKRRNESDLLKTFMGAIESGFGPVHRAGIVDCETMQERFNEIMLAEGLLKYEIFKYQDLTIEGTKAIYNGVDYDFIFFCEGAHAVNNPFFNWLPFNICKGEWIVIETTQTLTEKVINNITNIIPLGRNRYKLSSTYSWQNLDTGITESAKQTLTEHFEMLFPDIAYEVIQHEAGLRPTVADRRPYLGSHPIHKQLVILNGLGSKGVLLAPYFAQHLVSHIFEGTQLEEAVDIRRHIKRLKHSIS